MLALGADPDRAVAGRDPHRAGAGSTGHGRSEYREAGLDGMWSDIVDDAHGFAESRRGFILKQHAARTAAAQA